MWALASVTARLWLNCVMHTVLHLMGVVVVVVIIGIIRVVTDGKLSIGIWMLDHCNLIVGVRILMESAILFEWHLVIDCDGLIVYG